MSSQGGAPPRGAAVPAGLPAGRPPHDLTLFDHAEIAAELAEGTRLPAETLAARNITETQWNESTAFWMKRLGDDALEHGAAARVAIVYGVAFGKAQDALRAAPDMTPEAWATLLVEVQREGDPAAPLSRRKLSLSDFFRAARHFAALLPADAGAQARFDATFQALHELPPDA